MAFFSHRALSNKLHWMVTNCINDTYKYFSISLCDINLAKDFYISSTIVASIQYPRFFYVCFLCVYHYAYEYWRHAVNCAANAEKPGAFQHSRHKFHRYKEIPSIGTLISLWILPLVFSQVSFGPGFQMHTLCIL